ncbi:MAG: hypothetical protein ACFFA0_02670 [Promethearchaeota archaeon]
MDEQEGEDFKQEFDEDGFDPTKEAFFSDLIGMEEDIASEAYELVDHAMNLIESKYYDDSIEVLRQAIGLYHQINREEEINAIDKKISEVYLLKEKAFRDAEIESNQEVEKDIQFEIPEETLASDLKVELAQEELKLDLLLDATQLINEGKALQQNNNFEEALDKFDSAIEIFENMEKPDEVERVFKLIEECYYKKAEYLQSIKTTSLKAQTEPETIEQIGKEQLREEKVKQYLVSKKREEEVSTEAYKLLGQAADLSRNKKYDQALQLYQEGCKLFQELGWGYEVNKVQETISQLEEERDVYLQEIKGGVIEEKEGIGTKRQKVELIEHIVEESAEKERLERIERVRGLELQKMETEFFKAQIDNMVTEASRMAREYELAMQKAIKKGELIETCIYPQVIEIYKRIKELLLDKGWISEATIYDDTIGVYIQKFEQDKKIRQIEAEKIVKQKEAEELLKITEKEEPPPLKEEQLQLLDEHHKREAKIQKIRTEIEEMTKKAERLAREYEVALRKGKFRLKCPYPEIIKIFKIARQRSLQNGLDTDASIYLSQIQAFTDKLEKDNKLRQFEAEKALKQKEAEELLKVTEKEEPPPLKEEQLQLLDEHHKREAKIQKIRTEIEEMTKKAERLAREYEVALRKGKFRLKCPYPEIIKIFKIARQRSLQNGLDTDASIYLSQIQAFTDKLEKDNKLRQFEAEKALKQKQAEDMLKMQKEEKIIEEQKEKEEEKEDFQSYITGMVNKAEKLVREHETSMRKAMRKGEILENTPYLEVINIYHQIRKEVYARGWKNQAEIFANQIKIYQDKLEKHEKLLEIEAQKIQRQKDLQDMYKEERITEFEQSKLTKLERKKEEKEFQKHVIEMVNQAEKLEREYDSAMKKAIKKGELIEATPYPEIIEIYQQIQNQLFEKGWVDQSQIYLNQIKIYKEKLKKSEVLREVEAKKAKRQEELEGMHRVKKEFKPAKFEKAKELDSGAKEEDVLLDKAMNLIDEAEELVKDYERSIKTDVLLYQSPYEKVIANYNEAKLLFQKIGWNDEAGRLINTIKFYKEKKEKDEKLRELERSKLKKEEAELIVAKTGVEKELFAKEKRILEFEKKKKDDAKLAEGIFDEIHKAERLAQEYEVKIKDGIFDLEPPYEKILKIYRDARKKFEEIGWMEESMKLLSTIQFYKDKHEKDKRLRSLEIEKAKKLEEEHLLQQKLLKQAKAEQERLLKQREESLLLRKEKVSEFETNKNRAFKLMDNAKYELTQNNFEKAIDLYKESEEIFIQINWLEGINMVKDSIAMIKRKQQLFELEKQVVKEKRAERIEIEKKLKEKLVKAEELRKFQQEEKRKKFLKIQSEKQWERNISEEAYELLKQGTSLLDNKKFEEAYVKYIEARKLFNKISWKREVSRINNDLLFKLKRERKSFEILEDIKKKRVEEVKQMEVLKEETERERRERVKQKKEDKRRLEKEKFDKEILEEINRAEKLIENFKYNEGVWVLEKEARKLDKSGKGTEIKRIYEIIEKVKDQTQIPIITFETFEDFKDNEKFKIAYRALDKAQISLLNNHFMKTISELKESIFHLKEFQIGKKIIKEIEDKISELQKKLGKKPIAEEKEQENEMRILKARIAARREERRKKVLDLLGGSEEADD